LDELKQVYFELNAQKRIPRKGMSLEVIIEKKVQVFYAIKN